MCLNHFRYRGSLEKLLMGSMLPYLHMDKQVREKHIQWKVMNIRRWLRKVIRIREPVKYRSILILIILIMVFRLELLEMHSGKLRKLRRPNTFPFRVRFCRFIMKRFLICWILRKWRNRISISKRKAWESDGPKPTSLPWRIFMYSNVMMQIIVFNIIIRELETKL